MKSSHYVRTRTSRLLAIGAAIVVSTMGTAFAITGSDAYARSVVFYFGETSGSGDSQNFAGYGSGTTGAGLCTNADNHGSNTYVAQYIWNRTLQPDDVLKDVMRAYDQPQYYSGGIYTTNSRMYHTKATWSAVPSAPNDADGYSRDGFGGC